MHSFREIILHGSRLHSLSLHAPRGQRKGFGPSKHGEHILRTKSLKAVLLMLPLRNAHDFVGATTWCPPLSWCFDVWMPGTQMQLRKLRSSSAPKVPVVPMMFVFSLCTAQCTALEVLGWRLRCDFGWSHLPWTQLLSLH